MTERVVRTDLYEAAAAGVMAWTPHRTPPATDREGASGVLRAAVLAVTVIALVLVALLRGASYGISAGPTTDVRDLFGRPDRGGTLLATTVSVTRLDPLETVRAWLDPNVDVVRTHEPDRAAGAVEAGERALDVAVSSAATAARTQAGLPVDDPIAFVRPTFRGPSAGLMLALGFFEALTDEDLAGVLRVAGTGTISQDGTVGVVGGIPHKVTGAEAAGAEVFLVPAAQFDEARRSARTVQVVGVGDLGEALSVLRSLAVGSYDPECCGRR